MQLCAREQAASADFNLLLNQELFVREFIDLQADLMTENAKKWLL